jgi:hypothetical protein
MPGLDSEARHEVAVADHPVWQRATNADGLRRHGRVSLVPTMKPAGWRRAAARRPSGFNLPLTRVTVAEGGSLVAAD